MLRLNWRVYKALTIHPRRAFSNKAGNDEDYTIRRVFTSYDYYKILDCEPNANQEQIKQKFQQLAFKYHPDRLKDSANQSKKDDMAQRFMMIKEAYDVLSSVQQKAEFDKRAKSQKFDDVKDIFNVDQKDYKDDFESKAQSLRDLIQKLTTEREERELQLKKEAEEKAALERAETIRKNEQQRSELGIQYDFTQYEEELKKQKQEAYRAQ